MTAVKGSWSGRTGASRPGFKVMRNLNLESALRSESVVAFHFNGLGDRLMALPAVRALSALFPGRLSIICEKGDYATYYSDLPLRAVSEVEFRRASEGWLFDASKVAGEIGSCDLMVSFNTWHSDSARELLRLLRPANSIGFDCEFDHHARLEKDKHTVDTMFDLARLLAPALSLDEYSYPVALPSKDMERARQLRARLPEPLRMLVVHTETMPHKMWPSERFVSVLDQFLDAHKDYAAFVLDKANTNLDTGGHGVRVIHLPYAPVATRYAIVGCSDLFLGIDSCFLHAADLFRIPGVGLFGPTNHKVFGFRFGPHRHVCANGQMEDISETAVLEALESTVAEMDPASSALRG